MNTSLYLYEPKHVRTSNMASDRSSDIEFDAELEPSLTQQQFAAECNINNIVENHQKTGLLTHVNKSTPHWGDLGDGVDYQTALNHLLLAEESFMSLDAKIRAQFENDPAQFLDFVSDPANAEKMVEMGLATITQINPVSSHQATQPQKQPKTSSKSSPEASED